MNPSSSNDFCPQAALADLNKLIEIEDFIAYF